MLKIAVVDDEKSIVNTIGGLVNSYCKGKKIIYKLYKFYDGSDLINCGIKFDIIFLDIEMKTLSGIDAAQIIRKKDSNVVIVFITNYPAYWRKAYKVHAFDYIVKPINKNAFDLIMDDFILTVFEKNSQKIALNTSDGSVFLSMNEIRYFYIKEKKKLKVSTTTKGDFIVNENLSDVYEVLEKNQFFMPHRCCIVNLRFVKTLTKDRLIILDNQDYLPLSQRKKDEFIKRLSQNILNSVSQ